MRYVMARMQEYSRDMSYRIYVTDALKSNVENTKYHLSMDGMIEHGVQIPNRWSDSILPAENKKEDNRTCEEITFDIWKRAGLKKGD